MKKNATGLNIAGDELSQQVMKYKYCIFHDDATSRLVDDKEESLLRLQLPEVNAMVGWDGDRSHEVLIAHTKDKNRFESCFLSYYLMTLYRMKELLESEYEDEEVLEIIVNLTPKFEDYFQNYPKLKRNGVIHQLGVLVKEIENQAFGDDRPDTLRLVNLAIALAENWVEALAVG